MQTYQIIVSGGRDGVREIRQDLFAFSEILEVFVTSRPDSLVVVYAGRPRPAQWLRALRTLGYDVSRRRHSKVAPASPKDADAAGILGSVVASGHESFSDAEKTGRATVARRARLARRPRTGRPRHA
jgi:hypothetical protein